MDFSAIPVFPVVLFQNALFFWHENIVSKNMVVVGGTVTCIGLRELFYLTSWFEI